jgi:hypothetical protein
MGAIARKSGQVASTGNYGTPLVYMGMTARERTIETGQISSVRTSARGGVLQSSNKMESDYYST